MQHRRLHGGPTLRSSRPRAVCWPAASGGSPGATRCVAPLAREGRVPAERQAVSRPKQRSGRQRSTSVEYRFERSCSSAWSRFGDRSAALKALSVLTSVESEEHPKNSTTELIAVVAISHRLKLLSLRHRATKSQNPANAAPATQATRRVYGEPEGHYAPCLAPIVQPIPRRAAPALAADRRHLSTKVNRAAIVIQNTRDTRILPASITTCVAGLPCLRESNAQCSNNREVLLQKPFRATSRSIAIPRKVQRTNLSYGRRHIT